MAGWSEFACSGTLAVVLASSMGNLIYIHVSLCEITAQSLPSIFQIAFLRPKRICKTRRGRSGAQGLGLAFIRGPACENHQIKACGDTSVFGGESLNIKFTGPQQDRAPHHMPWSCCKRR